MRLLCVLILAAGALPSLQSPPAAQVPASSGPSAAVQLAPEVAAALLDKRVLAVYPEKARAKGIQGDIVVKILISELGEVKEATAISGDPDLVQAALESVRQWKYKPYTVDGKPVSVATQATFGFHIKTPPAPPPLGSFHDGRYEDKFFGIAYELSTHWVRETSLVRRQLESQEGAASSSQVLLAALHVPQSDGLTADSSLVMLASKQPAQGDAREYLESIATALRTQKLAKPRGETTHFIFAGLTAYRADFRPSHGDAQYQSMVCAIVKGYLLRWNFLAVSESSLDDAVATVAGITPFPPPPGSVPESAPPPETPSTVMKVSSGVTTGLLVKKVEPRYPPDAKAAHIQGQVTLHARIDKSGNVIDLEAISGPVELVPATVSAVRQWKYKPYLLKGEPIELDTTVEVRYTLGG